MSIVGTFINKVIATHRTGSATEHSYRSALESLFNSLAEGTTALNEPKRVACGAPDFIIQRGEIIVGHVEAKDIGVGLRAMSDPNKNQQERYLKALPNLIYTNCLDWDFYRNSELIASITIADHSGGINPDQHQYESLENLLRNFIAQRPQTITSSRVLAQMMAGKSLLIKDVLRNALKADENLDTDLIGQFKAFKEHLIHDITLEDFADIYAETISYGMFAARLHDVTLDSFSRQEALTLLPKSNPFLRNLFTYLAGLDLDERIAWIIDDLAAVFQAANVSKIMESFGRLSGQRDPFLHFYETFLAAYNPAKRKSRGVWYTPEPVVNFIVRSVDNILEAEFGLADGLANTSKVPIDWDTGQTDKKGRRVTIKKNVHRVQILDPATGTGTFLAEVIKQIGLKVNNIAPGMWSEYIEKELIPRLHGFELLMASYAMCHMKLEMIMTELGYMPTGTPPRLSVYLTNSLEEGDQANQTLPFAQWLSNEAKQANAIKRDMPIMCVIGNPPYSSSSANKGEWVSNLTAPYKADLDETSMNALSDDYVKFLRLAEAFVAANDYGIVAMITNNSFVDGVVHRKMRQHWRTTFDSIYVVNLHGDSNKKERTPSGEPDRNVFDIKQGVAITIGVKKGGSNALAEVFVKDIWGDRQSKYDWLWSENLLETKFEKADFQGDYHFFTNRPFGDAKAYEAGFKVDDLFRVGLSGIKFRKDRLLLTGNFSRADALQMVQDVEHLDAKRLLAKYRFAETSDWTVEDQRKNFRNAKDADILKIAYRPFDFRYAYYPFDRVNRIIPRGDSRRGLMKHMIGAKNIALLCGRQNKSGTTDHFLVSDCPSEMKAAESTIQSYHFPLYIYPDEQDLDQTRLVNFDEDIYSRVQGCGTHPLKGVPDEIAVFDYVYAVLYCPAYRKAYAEFLRIDFPRIPWPATPDEFWELSKQGKMLRQLHLLETAAIGKTPFPFLGNGDGKVGKFRFEDGKIWINSSQYFDKASDNAWNFSVGGYLPAQKWLKAREGRVLTFEDVKHYQTVLRILAETDRIMGEIKVSLESDN